MAASSRNRLVIASFCCLLGCGGQFGNSDDGGADAPLDGSAPDSQTSDVCVSPSGEYAVCGGPNGCFSDINTPGICKFCYAVGDQIGECETDAYPGPSATDPIARDGEIYVVGDPEFSSKWEPAPYEMGILYANNGFANRARYADWNAWTGDSLPEPATRPTFANFRTCGGNCGGCLSGEACVGRSPNHAYGICVPDWPNTGSGACSAASNWSCPANSECFVFVSSTDGQPLADQYGFCLSTTACEDAKTNYPGGAYCHVPQ